MGRKAADMVGKQFGRWTVIRRSHNDRGHLWWWCRCECGTEKAVTGGNLRSGQTRSCGCLLKEINRASMLKRYAGEHETAVAPPPNPGTHRHTVGYKKSRTYNTWTAMRKRCLNPNATNYKWYGGRGITIDPRWDKFENFLEDMGERPEGKTLDRIDPEGNYEPGNCRWATPMEQSANRRKR